MGGVEYGAACLSATHVNPICLSPVTCVEVFQQHITVNYTDSIYTIKSIMYNVHLWSIYNKIRMIEFVIERSIVTASSFFNKTK